MITKLDVFEDPFYQTMVTILDTVVSKITKKGYVNIWVNPPPPYVHKREHFDNTPSPLTGYIVCEWPPDTGYPEWCNCIFFFAPDFYIPCQQFGEHEKVLRMSHACKKNASVSVRTKCNISQSRWMSFLKVCVHYYVFYEGILYNISMICFRKNVLFF